MPSNLVAITAALKTRIETATGIANVLPYMPEENKPDLLFFVFDRMEVVGPPFGAQLYRWIYEGAYTVNGTNAKVVEEMIQARMSSLLDVMRTDMSAGGTIAIGHMLIREATGVRRVVIGKTPLPGAGFTIEVTEQVDGEYGILGG